MESGNAMLCRTGRLVEADIDLRVDQTGAVVREGVVDSDPEAIAVYVRSKAPDAVRIGLETGPTSTWLWTQLKQLGLPVICIDARMSHDGVHEKIGGKTPFSSVAQTVGFGPGRSEMLDLSMGID